MKVYIVVYVDYDDYYICSVLSNEIEADNLAIRKNAEQDEWETSFYRVEEWEVDE